MYYHIFLMFDKYLILEAKFNLDLIKNIKMNYDDKKCIRYIISFT